MHFVVLNAQVGNASALAFAGLQVEQEGIAIGLDAAKLIKLSIKVCIDHTAIAHQCRGLGQDRGLKQLSGVLHRLGGL